MLKKILIAASLSLPLNFSPASGMEKNPGFNAGDEAYVSPYRPGSAIAIDGDIGEWISWPGSVNYASEAQVVYGRDKWKGAGDLSGIAWTAWNESFLYLAADVRDDAAVQTLRGPDMWRGDHIEIYIDAAFEKGQGKGAFGEGQFHLGVSPGNFKNTGDPFESIPPEAAIWFPKADISPASIRVASMKTAGGYAIEAEIPWALLGMTPSEGASIGLDVCLSDADNALEGQKSMMSMLTGAWGGADRGRLVAMVLGNSEGGVAAGGKAKSDKPYTIEICEQAQVFKGKDAVLEFDLDDLPADFDGILSFTARIEHPVVGGGAQILLLALNGVNIGADKLANRGEFIVMPNLKASGPISTYVDGKGCFLFYSPDFGAIPRDHIHYVPELADNPHRFLFNLAGLLKKGKNVLSFKNGTGLDKEIVVRQCGISFKRINPKKKPPQSLGFVRPQENNKVDYAASLSEDGGIRISIDNVSYEVKSRFSIPDGGWCDLNAGEKPKGWEVRKSVVKGKESVSAANAYYRIDRTISKLDECVEVRDTLTSTAKENTGIMVRHMTSMKDVKEKYVNGCPIAFSATASDARNPTVFFANEKTGIGFMPEDDVFRVHSQNFFFHDSGVGGIADDQFVLRPGASYTFTWSVYPSKKTGYYDFVNAIRRKTGVNFRIEKLSFMKLIGEEGKIDRAVQYIRNVGANYISDDGAGFSLARLEKAVPKYKYFFDVMRAKAPDVKMFIYYHAFIDTESDSPEKYKDSRTCDLNGNQAAYGGKCDGIYPPLFHPTLDNSFGKVSGRKIGVILDECGADGVYWDEMEFSGIKWHYGDPWDGYTGVINPMTHNIEKYRSSVILLSQPWRVEMLEKILEAGKLIAANTPAQTETMAKYRFPRFAEGAAGASGLTTHCYTPIVLGQISASDSQTPQERAVFCYRGMLKALDQGALYYYGFYYERVSEPPHKMLCAYMFPITPIELHKGYIIGKERIITAVSGKFGWGDKSGHEVHVFNDEGVEVEFETRKIEKDGSYYTEIDMPEYYSAAILRK